MIRWFTNWLVWRVRLAIYGPPPDYQPITLKTIDDATADWVFEECSYMGEDVWKCPRCDSIEFMGTEATSAHYLHGTPYPKPEKCERCGWFKPGPLDLLAREGQ